MRACACVHVLGVRACVHVLRGGGIAEREGMCGMRSGGSGGFVGVVGEVYIVNLSEVLNLECPVTFVCHLCK